MAQKWAKQVYAEEKEKAWRGWCEEINHTTTLRDLWGKINTIEGRPTKEPHHPDPMGMAVELALKFNSLTNPTHLPKLHQETLEDLQPE